VWFGIAVAIGNTIAAGIVAAQGYIAALLPNIWLFLGVLDLGGIYALLGASSLAEWVLRFRAAVANTIILVALWASTPDSLWAGAIGFPPVAPMPWSHWLSVITAEVLFPVLGWTRCGYRVAVLFAFARVAMAWHQMGKCGQLLRPALEGTRSLMLE